jgi:Fe-S oxidoreductase
MPYDLHDPAYFDTAQVDKELRRITELCDGCRRCYRLCPSFDSMLDEAVDKNEGDHSKITGADLRRIVDLCWQCKLCYNHCPYTPPHGWDIDFPRLMLRAKAARAHAEGVTRQDAWLGNVDTIGALGSATAPLSNWANAFGPGRAVMEAVVGIHRQRKLPKFHRETFARWFARRGPKVAGGRKVAFFFSCSVNYNEPQVGKDAVAVLEKNGCSIACPAQVCCGMPFLDGGDVAGATANAQKNLASLLPLVRSGHDVIVPQPTCSYVLKKEYPMLVPGPEAGELAARTQDVFEYLANRRQEGSLATDFSGRSPGKVAYQVPCHLRAQNIGTRSADVLRAIPGTEVTVVERCSAVDGTWGFKTQYFDLSMKVAQPLFDAVKAAGAPTVATDCPLAGLQIAQGTGVEPRHPIQVLAHAYGLDDAP